MGIGQIGLDRRRMILMLRWVIIATAAYIVLTGKDATEGRRLAYVLLFALSNVALAFVPRRLIEKPEVGPLLLMIDGSLTLFGLSWQHGFGQDLLIAYFFTIFLTTIGETLASIAISSGLVIFLYGCWLSTQPHAFTPEAWLRLPFFFLIAVFYGSLIEQLKAERRRREMAERESGHLRVLLNLAGAFSESHATREFIDGIGREIEDACPGLSSHVLLGQTDPGPATSGRALFPLRAHGTQYGTLVVERRDGSALEEREEWLATMVAHAAAGALYAADRSSAAESADQVKNQFLATISHELRTPLHAVLGYADVLEMTVPADQKDLRNSVERVRINACRLQDLVEQLLGFAELRAGHRSARNEDVCVGELVDGLDVLTREQLGGKHVEVQFKVSDAMDELRTDRRKLRQVLSCLLSNAAKFTDRGQITLTTARRNGAFEVTVSDTGVGISPDDLSSIFEEFKQADGSLTRRHGGLGLGLALSQELIDLLGGTLQVDSHVGSGTTVRVQIPTGAEPRAAAAAMVGMGRVAIAKL